MLWRSVPGNGQRDSADKEEEAEPCARDEEQPNPKGQQMSSVVMKLNSIPFCGFWTLWSATRKTTRSTGQTSSSVRRLEAPRRAWV